MVGQLHTIQRCGIGVGGGEGSGRLDDGSACACARPGFDPGPCQWQGGLAHRACQQAVAAGIRIACMGLGAEG